ERTLWRFEGPWREYRNAAATPQENILIIEASQLAWLFIRMVEEFASAETHIVGILDRRPQLYNRSLNGYFVVGSPDYLEKIVHEYVAHGVKIHKIVIAADPATIPDALWTE